MGLFLFKRDRVDPPVQPGHVYRRMLVPGVPETARVLSIFREQTDIPHVRFVVRQDCAGKGACDHRTLSEESFRRLFRERVAG